MANQSLYQLLQRQATQTPDGVAILAPDRIPLTYRTLYLQVEKTVEQLSRMGIHRHDRVAIVVPNGPEMATLFLSVASGATSAPLNPAYRAAEFQFYLSDLNARALIIQANLDSPAREVAQARGIPIIDLSPDVEKAAGVFCLGGYESHTSSEKEFARPDDAALVLHTSGTTSRPKIVPLTHTNICSSAHNIATTLALTGSDRCLNVMPLFHIHGLIGAVLSSLSAGASLICTTGFHADQFFHWLAAFYPTWYTAVPTMHQAILSRVDVNRKTVDSSSLRFIRSSSASLPPQVMAALEEAFKAPVIESYGMTEASHQMTSNPLPPGQRKPGTVGVAAGPEVTIMDAQGNLLAQGEIGEIVIRGSNVTPGYDNNQTANQNAFTNGWFRTADQGTIDADGYLRIIGRIKEIVNRGGEKITPREIDEAFLNHPDVAQAVAFAVPHPTLGEDLAVAVVLRDKATVTPQELRQFAFANLANHKVPTQVVTVEEIPKGPTGKLQRIGLAEKLASKLKAQYVPPRNSFEEALAKIWAERLKLERVGIKDNFFGMGGDSLTGVQVLVEMERLTGKTLHQSILFEAPTIEQIAEVLQNKAAGSTPSYLLPIQPGGEGLPFFCVPGHGGDVFTFVELGRTLGRPVYTFRFPDEAAKDDDHANAMIEELASHYVGEMQAMQPIGPYHLLGFCFGGEVIFKMAQLLRAHNQTIGLVAIINAHLPGSVRFAGFRERLLYHFDMLHAHSPGQKLDYVAARLKNLLRKMNHKLSRALDTRSLQSTHDASQGRRSFPGRLTLFRTTRDTNKFFDYDPEMGWGRLANEVEVYEVAAEKTTIFKEPHIRLLVDQLKRCVGDVVQ